MMLTITIFDANGLIISETVSEPASAAETDIDEMIQIIEAGAPAWLAAQICRSPSASRPARNTPGEAS